MPMTPHDVLRGAWYALEQSGRLLADSVALFDRDSFGTAIAIALLSREELGKARILFELRDEAEQGRLLEIRDVRIGDHERKQRSGQVHINAPLPWTLADLLNRFGDDEQAAVGEMARIFEAMCQALPTQRKTLREKALYVDLDATTGDWSRPVGLSRAQAHRAVLAAANDYVSFVGLLNTDAKYAQARAALEGWTERPELPRAVWPGP